MLSGSAQGKAAHKMLMKLITPGVNIINVLQAAFALKDPKSSNMTDNLNVFLRFWDLRV